MVKKGGGEGGLSFFTKIKKKQFFYASPNFDRFHGTQALIYRGGEGIGGKEEEILADGRTDQSKAVQEVLDDLKIWKIFVFSSGTIFKKPFCPASLTLTSHWLMKVASRLKLVFTTRRHIGANYLVGVLNLVSFPTKYFNI